MIKFVVSFLCVSVLVASFVSDSQARGSKAERLDQLKESYEDYKQTKTTLAQNEAFAKQHPAEAKVCFDPMMATADQHGIERHVYFTDNQAYFRGCIEQQLGTQ